jgi:nanoRNase/pAp phosphatase (c-di-AMP/oligoRNAs hydrolase)
MNTVEQLDEAAEAIKKSPAPKIIIDHHAPNQETMALCKLCFIDDTAAANCELIYRLYDEAQVTPTLNEAKALFVGTAFDTRHFALSNSSTLQIVAKLAALGIDVQDTLATFALPIDPSERMAKLKACKRAKIVKVGDWIIALSHVSAYQASAAKSLVDLGAHMSAVAGKKNDKMEISLRSTREFHLQSGVHLGTDIAAPLGEFLGGVGGVRLWSACDGQAAGGDDERGADGLQLRLAGTAEPGGSAGLEPGIQLRRVWDVVQEGRRGERAGVWERGLDIVAELGEEPDRAAQCGGELVVRRV